MHGQLSGLRRSSVFENAYYAWNLISLSVHGELISVEVQPVPEDPGFGIASGPAAPLQSFLEFRPLLVHIDYGRE